jgi:hypothetical protein
MADINLVGHEMHLHGIKNDSTALCLFHGMNISYN